MIRDPLHTLVHLIATEVNPHQLVMRVVSEASVLEEVRRLSGRLLGVGVAGDARIMDCCRIFKIPLEFFGERLQLLARILNLLPYDQNYYEILGIGRRASQSEIKQAFRRKSFASHPDTNPHDPNAAERFRNLQNAYEVLGHEQLRRQYDQNLKEHLWDEEEDAEERLAGPARWGKWHRLWPVGLLLLLVAVIFVVDYSQWQTERYYAGVKTHPARSGLVSPVPSAGVPPKTIDEAARHTPSLSEAAAPEPDQPQPSPGNGDKVPDELAAAFPNQAESPGVEGERSAKPVVPVEPDSSSRPGESRHDTQGTRAGTAGDAVPKATQMAALPGDGAKRGEPAPSHNVTDSSRRESLTATATPQQAATVKAAQKLPPPVSRSERQSGLPEANDDGHQPSGAKPAGLKPAAPPASPNHVPATSGFTRMENLDQEIRTFLFRYTSTYEARDMRAFLRFFEANAIENGRPIQELIPIYQANFKRAEKLRYRISVGRWEMGEGEVMVDGSFRLAVQFEQEDPVESRGSIQLTLVRRDGDFGVKQLNYIFRESKKSSD